MSGKQVVLYLDDNEWMKFQIQSTKLGLSSSERVREFIKNQIKKDEVSCR